VTRGAAEESANGIRALTGYRSPIKQQNDLGSWAAAALNIVTGAKLYPSAFRTTSSKAHPSPGARQWALHLQAGHRLAIALDTTTNPPPFFPAVTPWVVALRFTLEPDTFTLDLTCAPPTGAN
jgi:hypothetical protein